MKSIISIHFDDRVNDHYMSDRCTKYEGRIKERERKGGMSLNNQITFRIIYYYEEGMQMKIDIEKLTEDELLELNSV